MRIHFALKKKKKREKLPNFFGTLIKVNGLISLFRCNRMNLLPLVNSRSSHRLVFRTASDVFFKSSNSARTINDLKILLLHIISNITIIHIPEMIDNM